MHELFYIIILYMNKLTKSVQKAKLKSLNLIC